MKKLQMISRDTEYSMLKQEIISMTDIISNIELQCTR